jgi:hypothetical protein
MSKQTVRKHFRKLETLARRNHGVLPTAKWLNANGFFGSYDIVRKAGLLGKFKHAYAY